MTSINAVSVRLAGKEWPVPMLSARQNRIIDPIILSLLPLFSEWQGDKVSALTKLGRGNYESLQDMVFYAIERASPQLTRDVFLDLPVTLPELVAAFPVIAQQTGIFSREDNPGEGAAGNALTGT